MNFWHISMRYPYRSDGGVDIDSRDLLVEDSPVIAMNGPDNQASLKEMQNGDIVLVRNGATPIALCKVAGPVFSDKSLNEKYCYDIYRKVEVLDFYPKGTNDSFPDKRRAIRKVGENAASRRFIENWYTEILKKKG